MLSCNGESSVSSYPVTGSDCLSRVHSSAAAYRTLTIADSLGCCFPDYYSRSLSLFSEVTTSIAFPIFSVNKRELSLLSVHFIISDRTKHRPDARTPPWKRSRLSVCHPHRLFQESGPPDQPGCRPFSWHWQRPSAAGRSPS